MKSERGNVSLIALAGVGLALVLCLGVARVGSAVVVKSRADSAADAAALAAADQLALGHGITDVLDAARAAAADNHARLVSCWCSDGVAEVTVEMTAAIGTAHGHARAEVDLSRQSRPGEDGHPRAIRSR
jgi:secretion/DNA translocation related TadE-like protein